MTLFTNVKWVAFSQLSKIGCQLLGMLIFSRFLSAKEFGIMSMALVVVNFANIIRDLGVSSAIIQLKTLNQKLISSVFFLNLFFGFILLFSIFFFADDISCFFNESKLTDVLMLIAFSFPIASITSTHLSLMERESKFNSIAKVEIFSSITALILGVFVSYIGGGVYSLVTQTLAYSSLSAIGLFFYTRWIPSAYFSFAEVRGIFKFTSNLVLFNFVNYFSRNSDQIIIGRFFSSTILGQYSLAYRIMLFPIQNITFVLTRSLFPLLSRNQSNSQYSLSLYLHVLKTLAIVIPPLMVGIAVVSDDFVKVVLGEKWNGVAILILYLAPTAILQSFISTTGSVFMAQGRTNTLFQLSLFNAFLQVGAFILGATVSVVFIIKLYFIANLVIFFPNIYFAMRLLGGKWRDFLFISYKPLLSVLLMLVLLLFLKGYLNTITTFPSLRLAILVFLGGVSYIGFLSLLERKKPLEIIK
ncbi:TPA: lipopolysaccharide biosynthesis protein, partial [Klebsiella pneumoniae]|nr:lipopolysaccharide biosynthesis protein [Klebsiella pneumoniae]